MILACLYKLLIFQDAEYEDPEQEEERYTSDLLEGLFPDEDFTRLGKPFELIRDSRGEKLGCINLSCTIEK